MNSGAPPPRVPASRVIATALACVVLVALAWAWLVPHAAPSLSASGRRLVVVVVAIVTAQLTFPMRSVLPARIPRDLLVWPLLAGGGAAAAVAATGDMTPAVAALAAGAALLTACLEALTRLSRAAGAAAGPAMGGVLLAFAIAALAPLWLGPLAETFAAHGGVTDAVVALSPLSYLAATVGYDVLREHWLYANSPIGSLRFVYPGVAAATAAYLGIVVFAALLARRLEARRDAPPSSTGTRRGRTR